MRNGKVLGNRKSDNNNNNNNVRSHWGPVSGSKKTSADDIAFGLIKPLISIRIK